MKGNTKYDREEGYIKALNNYGIPVDKSLIISHNHELECLPGVINKILSIINICDFKLAGGGRPTAIFGFNDYLAIGLISLLEQHGIKVPEDMSIVGFDNIELSQYAKVPLTTVDFNGEEVTTAAVDLLIDKIKNKNTKIDGGNKIRKIIVEPELIIRDSTKRVIN
jgi:DNA-binding LacI/PurR family transcriptional regulator